MNGETYVCLLKSKLECQMKVHNCGIFMHDNAPCHQSKVGKKFLKQKPNQMSERPGNSPNLNPVL